MSEEQCQLLVDPPVVDLGCLQPHASAKVMIRVVGGPATISTNNERIQVTPCDIGKDPADVLVSVNEGSEGELIWDLLHVKGDKGELDAPIVCLWSETLAPSSREPMPDIDAREAMQQTPEEQEESTVAYADVSGIGKVEPVDSVPAQETALFARGRTYVGQSCHYCRRNLRYDSQNRVWLACERCKGARILRSVPEAVIRDTIAGIRRDGKKILKDLWDVIIGKQGWNLK